MLDSQACDRGLGVESGRDCEGGEGWIDSEWVDRFVVGVLWLLMLVMVVNVGRWVVVG
jgi:hypothetical protein